MFRTLYDADEVIEISEKLNNGDFDYYLLIRLENMLELTGDDEFKKKPLLVSINVVSPEQVPEEEMKRANESCGDPRFTVKSDEAKAELLLRYGIYVPVWSKYGNDDKELLQEAREFAPTIEGLFGFYMDRPVNRIGTTGWEMLRGDLLAPINRMKETSPETSQKP